MEEFWTETQKEDIKFYKENLDSLLANPLYRLKYVLIHGKEIAGFFDTFEAALTCAASKYQAGEYIIQQVISDKDVVEFLYSAMDTA